MGDRTDFNYLYEPEGTELHWDGLKQVQASQPAGASLAALSARSKASGGLSGTSAQDAGGYPSPAPQKPAQRAYSPAELHQMADAMLAQAEAGGQAPRALSQRDSSGGVLPKWLTDYMDSQ